MAAILMSAKVTVFDSMINNNFPQVFPKVLLDTNTN